MLGAGKGMWGSVSGTRSCWGQTAPLEQSGYCPLYFFDISRLSLLGEYLGHWSGGGRLCLITSTNEHFSHFGCRNSKYITSEMLLPWQTGHTSGRYRFKPVSTQEEFHAALLNFGVSKVSTQTAEATLQHPCPPSLHKLQLSFSLHPFYSSRNKSEARHKVSFPCMCVWCVRKAKHIFPEFQFRG